MRNLQGTFVLLANVLINLRKRFESGPMDWTDWLTQLKKMRDDAAKARDEAGATKK